MASGEAFGVWGGLGEAERRWLPTAPPVRQGRVHRRASVVTLEVPETTESA